MPSGFAKSGINTGQFKKGSSGFRGKHTEEAKKKMSGTWFKKGHKSWNAGTNKSGMKGKKRTLEWKAKMRSIFLGRERVDLRGVRHPNWRGGLTPLMLKVRNCFKYIAWRSSCFLRDNYTCQICLERGGKLNVDHFPKRFSDIFYENKINSYQQALDCKELWKIENGRTLCVPCHKKIPTKLKGDGKRKKN